MCTSPKHDVGLSLWPVSLKVSECSSDLKENVSNNFKYSYLIYWAFMFLPPQLGCYGLCRNLRRDCIFTNVLLVNTLRQWQNGRHFVNDIFKCIFLNINVWIPIEISLKFNPGVQLTIFQHWFSQWLGNRCQSHCLNQWWLPSLPTHICFTRPLWVNKIVLRLTQPVFSICIYCILNRTCLLYASILYGKQ